MTASSPAQGLPSPSQWEHQRSHFSHDWLRNRLAILLGKYGHVLAGKVLDDGVHDQITALVDEWLQQREDIFRLVEEAVDVLNPRRSFESEVFRGIDPAALEEAAAGAERDWLQRAGPVEAARRARESLRHLDAVLAGWPGASAPGGGSAAEWTQVARVAVIDAAEALAALGRCRHG